MQPRAEEIYRVLTTFIQSKRSGNADGSRRRSFALVVQGSSQLEAQIRDLRGACAMIDIGSSIFTLAYNDILGIDPIPAADGGLRVTVKPGCFASHVAARLRRSAPRPWSSTQSRPLAEPESHLATESVEMDEFLLPSSGKTEPGKTEGGAAESDPAESARQDVVGNNASRVRER